MTWTVPKFSKEQVNEAGNVFARGGTQMSLEHAEEVINNFRSSHAFPLNTIQANLRNKAREVDPAALTAQRIKRLPSIHKKLVDRQMMKLTQMQDVGGCRAIVNSVNDVRRVVTSFKKGKMKHRLASEDDYISTPRSTGYRGVHLVYRYVSDHNETYNDLKIEVQIRSKLQHAWATAVEVVGMFTGQALKSSAGEQQWLRFFALMASAGAIIEKTPTVPGTPTNRMSLIRELKGLESTLKVRERLAQYGQAIKETDENNVSGAKYLLLRLNTQTQEVRIKGYKQRDISKAETDYLSAEKTGLSSAGLESVLVSVESMASLRRAYPNYFLDTKKFVELVDRALKL